MGYTCNIYGGADSLQQSIAPRGRQRGCVLLSEEYTFRFDKPPQECGTGGIHIEELSTEPRTF